MISVLVLRAHLMVSFFFFKILTEKIIQKPNKSDKEVEYEEFKAEINDNVLCVRVPKNTGVVRRVYDNESPKQEVYSDVIEINYPKRVNLCICNVCLGLLRSHEKNSNYSGKSKIPGTLRHRYWISKM